MPRNAIPSCESLHIALRIHSSKLVTVIAASIVGPECQESQMYSESHAREAAWYCKLIPFAPLEILLVLTYVFVYVQVCEC